MLVEASENDSGELWTEALERGRIVRFARPPFELPAPGELDFLREGLAPFLERKNVSYYPEAERLTGLRGPPEVRRRAQAILRQHSRRVRGFLEREKITADGPAITIYLATDDTGFQYHAAIPVAEPPKEIPRGDLAVGKSPEGKALKFVHRGSYDAMDTTYDAITNYLDQKGLEAKDLFIEQYVTDPVTMPEDKLVIEVYVPVK